MISMSVVIARAVKENLEWAPHKFVVFTRPVPQNVFDPTNKGFSYPWPVSRGYEHPRKRRALV